MNKEDSSPDLLEHLASLSRMVRRRPPSGKTVSHGAHRVLCTVLRNDGIRTSELAEKLDIRPASLTDVLKRLEEDGQIKRVKDERDSRVSHVHATEKAKAERKQHELERRSQSERMSNYLTEEEVEEFCKICDKLCRFLEAEQNSRALEEDPHGEHS